MTVLISFHSNLYGIRFGLVNRANAFLCLNEEPLYLYNKSMSIFKKNKNEDREINKCIYNTLVLKKLRMVEDTSDVA